MLDLLPNPNPRLGQRPFIVSPGLSQVFAADSGFGWVIGPSTVRFLWQANDPVFIGEDLYCSGLISLDADSMSLGSDTSFASSRTRSPRCCCRRPATWVWCPSWAI